jgi:hypothetical protein
MCNSGKKPKAALENDVLTRRIRDIERRMKA